MGSEKIVKIALSHFARDGYEGASLQNIAEEVGIRKSSLYAHFKGKDVLFLNVFKYVIRHEKKRMILFFKKNKNESLEYKLKNLPYAFEHDSKLSDNPRCLLRLIYFPPFKLRNEVADIVNPFLDYLQTELVKVFQMSQDNKEITCSHIENGALAYITFIDGILLDLLYSDDLSRFHNRVNATWPIFWSGLNTN